MQRRDLLKCLAGAGTLAGLHPLSVLAGGNNTESFAAASGAGSSRIEPVTSAKNLVIIVNMLGYNQHTFNPQADDLNSSPLLAQLKDHHGDLTVFKGIKAGQYSGAGRPGPSGQLFRRPVRRGGPEAFQPCRMDC